MNKLRIRLGLHRIDERDLCECRKGRGYEQAYSQNHFNRFVWRFCGRAYS